MTEIKKRNSKPVDLKALHSRKPSINLTVNAQFAKLGTMRNFSQSQSGMTKQKSTLKQANSPASQRRVAFGHRNSMPVNNVEPENAITEESMSLTAKNMMSRQSTLTTKNPLNPLTMPKK